MAIAIGISVGFQRAIITGSGRTFTLQQILALFPIFGMVMGIIYVYGGAFVLNIAARILGGASLWKKAYKIIAYSNIPSLLWLFIIFPLSLAIFRQDTFLMLDRGTSNAVPWLSVFFGFLMLITSAWAMILLIKGIQAVYDFTVLRSISVILLTIPIFGSILAFPLIIVLIVHAIA